MNVLPFIIYGLFFTVGFISSDYIIKRSSPEFFIEIQTRTKKYKAKIHHIYLSIVGLLTYFFDAYILTSLFAGIGTHDAVIEIKNKVTKKLNKRGRR
ncbi:MAG: hypothetical protein ACP5GJ_00910 [Nanopusillaceae archaeon]